MIHLIWKGDKFQAEKRDTSFLKEKIDRIREDRERGGSEGKTSRSERRRAVVCAPVISFSSLRPPNNLATFNSQQTYHLTSFRVLDSLSHPKCLHQVYYHFYTSSVDQFQSNNTILFKANNKSPRKRSRSALHHEFSSNNFMVLICLTGW